MDDRTAENGCTKGFSGRWPHIERYLRDADTNGWIRDDFALWAIYTEVQLTPADRAAAYEEWAEFFEWRMSVRTAELANDRCARYLVTEWADSMSYCCRRSAAWARGENPGAWIPQWQRRPDLHAESVAIVDDIIAGLKVPCQPTAMAGTR